MKCDFSSNHYRAILKNALEAGFVITNFRDFDKVKLQPKLMILRHDIDMAPAKALNLAKIEKKLGILASYFVRVHGEFYYPSEEKILPILKEIKALGHEIGLHTEAHALANLWRSNKVAIFFQEKQFLEEILAINVETAVDHADLGRSKDFWRHHFFANVSKAAVGIKRFPQEKKYQKYHYLSDSLKHWREGCLCLNLAKYQKIQALIHPDWWVK